MSGNSFGTEKTQEEAKLPTEGVPDNEEFAVIYTILGGN